MSRPAATPLISSRRPLFFALLLQTLLLIGDIHPHKGPTPPLPSYSVVSWNRNGLRNSAVELSDFLARHRVKVVCLQETKLSANASTPKFPDYAVIRRDRPTGGGGGLVTLVHHSLNYIEIQTPLNDNFAESIIVKTTISGLKLQIVNLYIPPQSSCAPNFAASLSPILTNKFFIVGDINAHSAFGRWGLMIIVVTLSPTNWMRRTMSFLTIQPFQLVLRPNLLQTSSLRHCPLLSRSAGLLYQL